MKAASAPSDRISPCGLCLMLDGSTSRPWATSRPRYPRNGTRQHRPRHGIGAAPRHPLDRCCQHGRRQDRTPPHLIGTHFTRRRDADHRLVDTVAQLVLIRFWRHGSAAHAERRRLCGEHSPRNPRLVMMLVATLPLEPLWADLRRLAHPQLRLAIGLLLRCNIRGHRRRDDLLLPESLPLRPCIARPWNAPAVGPAASTPPHKSATTQR